MIDGGGIDEVVDSLMNDRRWAHFPLVPLVTFGHLFSDVEVVSLFGLLLVFDASGPFVDTTPVGIVVFLHELSVYVFSLAKTVQSRKRAVALDYSNASYRICGEPSVVVGDSEEGYEDARDPGHGGPGCRGEPEQA